VCRLDGRYMMSQWVSVQITSTITQFASERRFDVNLNGEALKAKLELITGTTSQWMHLDLYDNNNTKVGEMKDSDTLLSLGTQDGWRVHVIDQEPNKQLGEFDDLSKVEKFELNEEEYDKKQDSVRNFLKKNKLGKFSETAAADKAEEEKRLAEKEAKEAELSKNIQVGDRCQVSVPKQPKKIGSVAYVGDVDFKPGSWVGVKYDEPLGKNDGSVKGKRYFTCQPKYGGFVRPSQVEVGDFPEDDFGMDDDEI